MDSWNLKPRLMHDPRDRMVNRNAGNFIAQNCNDRSQAGGMLGRRKVGSQAQNSGVEIAVDKISLIQVAALGTMEKSE